VVVTAETVTAPPIMTKANAKASSSSFIGVSRLKVAGTWGLLLFSVCELATHGDEKSVQLRNLDGGDRAWPGKHG